MPVIFIAIRDATYPKIISNMEKVRSRKGRIIAIATEDDHEISRLAEEVIVIPLQLLAYHIAVLRGCNVDHPRNLARSVTVE